MCRLYCSPPLRTAHSHHTAPYANHAPRCESGRSQRTMGSLAGFPQLGECSSISITLLLVSQDIPGRVHGSLHTPPIHFMGSPLNVRGNGVTADQLAVRRLTCEQSGSHAQDPSQAAFATALQPDLESRDPSLTADRLHFALYDIRKFDCA